MSIPRRQRSILAKRIIHIISHKWNTRPLQQNLLTRCPPAATHSSRRTDPPHLALVCPWSLGETSKSSCIFSHAATCTNMRKFGAHTFYLVLGCFCRVSHLEFMHTFWQIRSEYSRPHSILSEVNRRHCNCKHGDAWKERASSRSDT